ncbi:MAG: TatD family hydrolase [Gemmatimonadetes bacterium]|nr:TatD family hydrolase [Gemmatimonadota bacterium]MDA1104001.1 TatD family hydrolase [Gemmatimonadota bacterium]
MIEYFDSHCHLTDAAFRDDREAVFRRATEAGVTRLVSIASHLSDAREALELAVHRAGVWCSAGVHPHAAGEAPPEALDEIRALAVGHPQVVAIGETGLDYHYDSSPRPVQRSLFEAHLGLAAELDLPVVVHAREADEDIAAALRAMPRGTSGVLHCFTGGDRAFEEAMAADWYVSFSGIASFKSFEPIELLRQVPLTRLLIETDSPYLSPVPKRGRRNEPAHVVLVAGAVAAHLGMDSTEVAARTTENACRFYGVA